MNFSIKQLQVFLPLCTMGQLSRPPALSAYLNLR